MPKLSRHDDGWCRPGVRVVLCVLAVLGAVALGSVAGLAPMARANTDVRSPRPTFELGGVALLPEAAVRKAAGRPPRKQEDLARWEVSAVKRIVALYVKHGYTQARCWSRIDSDGVIRIHVDEGVMARVVFVGVGAYRGMVYRIDLNLPGDVFNAKVLDGALAELKGRFGFSVATYSVVETEYLLPTPLGYRAPVRELRIVVVSPERYGWGFDLSSDSIWGPVLRGRFGYGSLLLEKDLFNTELKIAVPYRRFLFDVAPQLNWVNGEWEIGYRMPPFASGHLAPQIDGAISVSHFSRLILNVHSGFVLRTSAVPSIAILFRPLLDASIGLGIEYYHLFGVVKATATEASTLANTVPVEISPDDQGLLRFTLPLVVELHFSPGVLREDLRDELWIEIRNSFAPSGSWLGSMDLQGRGVWGLGAHLLMVKYRGILQTGDVRFFDDTPLAGNYMRAFFDSRYWVREAVQIEVAFRVAVWRDSLLLGVFNDLALFADRSYGKPVFAAADAAGPSLHFFLFDRFACDFYYGFGLAPVGFSHNFSFELGTVF
jgi:hypothetical protein